MKRLPFVIAILILAILLGGCTQQMQVQPAIPKPQPTDVVPPPQPSTEIPTTATVIPGHLSKIAFVRSGISDWDIFTADSDGGSITNITNSPSQDLWPSWSPDGKQIVFQSSRGGLGQSIYVMDADGANAKCLTLPPINCQFPAWSPDGTKIAYSSSALASGFYLDIFTMNKDGTSKSPVLRVARDARFGTYSQVCPSWFPDSQRIAYASNRLGFWEIMEVTSNNNINIGPFNADTSDSKSYPIYINGHGLRFPFPKGIFQPNTFPALSVSPDGRTIAFDYYDNMTTKRDIYVLDIGSRDIKCLTCGESSNCYFPTWSPDGSKIAFTLESNGKTNIYMMDSDGSNPALLIENGMFPSWQK